MMNIHAKHGHRVMATEEGMKSGRPSDQVQAQEYLVPGLAYTVNRTVYGYPTLVYLVEIPGVAFNSVHFEDADESTPPAPPRRIDVPKKVTKKTRKNDLIAKQALKISKYEEQLDEVRKIRGALAGMLVGIGRPLNDNTLKFNKEQLRWCSEVWELIDQLP